MTFFIQHGYGKGSKIRDTAAFGGVDGVILSPGDEEPARLAQTARDAAQLGLKVRIDPQTYVHAPEPSGTAAHHAEHGLNLEISWHATPKQVTRAVNAVRGVNEAVNAADRWFAPTCWLASFEGIWTPVSLALAAAAAEDWGSSRTVVSVAVSEDAFADWRAVDIWLDAATTLDVAGFYILVDRKSSTYPPSPWNVSILANILRVIYRLGELNGYEVTWGYSDVEGLLGLAAGATGSASGWHYSLRQFNRGKWIRKPSGGSAPTPRVLVSSLWAPLRAADEVYQIMSNRDLAPMLSLREREALAAKPLTAFTIGDAHVQYLAALANMSCGVTGWGGVEARLSAVLSMLDEASRAYELIADAGIVLDSRYKNRVKSLRDAVEELVASERIALE